MALAINGKSGRVEPAPEEEPEDDIEGDDDPGPSARAVGNKQGERGVPLALSLKPALRDLLALAAADQFRATSAQATKYIVDGLLRDGYIKPSTEPVDP